MFGWASLTKLTKQEQLNQLKSENAVHITTQETEEASSAAYQGLMCHN